MVLIIGKNGSGNQSVTRVLNIQWTFELTIEQDVIQVSGYSHTGQRFHNPGNYDPRKEVAAGFLKKKR